MSNYKEKQKIIASDGTNNDFFGFIKTTSMFYVNVEATDVTKI